MNLTSRAKDLHAILRRSQVFAWDPAVTPDEHILEKALCEVNGHADKVICDILLSSIEMFDQAHTASAPAAFVSAERNRPPPIPRPPLWYWDLFPDDDLMIFGYSTCTNENYQKNEDGVQWYRNVGSSILEAVWNSEYLELEQHKLAPSAKFLDFRDDFGHNWTRLLLLLYHICHHLYSDLGPGNFCGTSRSELFMRVMSVAIYWELEVLHTQAENDLGHFQATSHEEMFQRLRGIFPTAENLGPCAAQTITDELIRTVLVAHKNGFAPSLEYLTMLSGFFEDSTDKHQEMGTRAFSARDVLLHDPSLGARCTYFRPTPARAQRDSSLPLAPFAKSPLAPPMKNWQSTQQTLERMMDLPINRLSLPRVICDEQYGLVMHGWGAVPEAGSDLGRPFSQGVMVHRLDLHTVRVREALQLIASLLHFYTQLRTRNNESSRVEVAILVGRGLHSAAGPRLGPHLAAFLRRNGASFREDDAWLVLKGL